MIEGMLAAKGIKVVRRRLRESIHRIDPVNTALRWLRANPRWKYDVPGPNSLWHNDGLHKLIRWGFVIHACIDGYSRMVTSLLCATNNLAATCLAGFLGGVEKFGVPERVRGDNGTENNDIERYMNRERGGGSYLRGPSVHNQRIERLHYDTTHCCLSHYINLFKFLEENEILSPDDSTDLFSLHFVYKGRIQKSLDEFRNGWNSHRLSSCGNKSPNQLFLLGVMDTRKRCQIGVESAINRDTYGVEPLRSGHVYDDEELSSVELYDVRIGDRDDDIVNTLQQEIDVMQDDGNHGIEIYCRVKTRIGDIMGL